MWVHGRSVRRGCWILETGYWTATAYLDSGNRTFCETLPIANCRWILDTGFWFAGLNTGHFVKNCLLPTAAGFWKLDTENWSFCERLPTAYCNCLLPLHTGNRTFCERTVCCQLPLDTGYWIMDTGLWKPDIL
jgi:hypothetical protein